MVSLVPGLHTARDAAMALCSAFLRWCSALVASPRVLIPIWSAYKAR